MYFLLQSFLRLNFTRTRTFYYFSFYYLKWQRGGPVVEWNTAVWFGMRAEEFPDHVVEDIPLLGKQIGPERGKLPTELEEPCSPQNIVPHHLQNWREPCSQSYARAPNFSLYEKWTCNNVLGLLQHVTVRQIVRIRPGSRDDVFGDNATTILSDKR